MFRCIKVNQFSFLIHDRSSRQLGVSYSLDIFGFFIVSWFFWFYSFYFGLVRLCLWLLIVVVYLLSSLDDLFVSLKGLSFLFSIVSLTFASKHSFNNMLLLLHMFPLYFLAFFPVSSLSTYRFVSSCTMYEGVCLSNLLPVLFSSSSFSLHRHILTRAVVYQKGTFFIKIFF